MFLSANNFFWQVERRSNAITKTELWRNSGGPESSLIGVQYIANGRRAPAVDPAHVACGIVDLRRNRTP